uniref:SAP domain-containing protein n=1 Tax=Alexandrium monilatum TaxID=311494 RepID=A0A7S4UF02_9DINO
MTVSLAARLAVRGAPRPPASDDPGRECGPPPPEELRPTEGSLRLRGQAQDFVSTVLRARTLLELREECKSCSLPVRGQKEKLIARLAGIISGFSTGGPSEACSSPPRRRRLSVKSPDTPPPKACSSPPRRRRLSVKSPDTPPPKAQDEKHLLSVRKVTGFKRKRHHEDLCAMSPSAACVC